MPIIDLLSSNFVTTAEDDLFPSLAAGDGMLKTAGNILYV